MTSLLNKTLELAFFFRKKTKSLRWNKIFLRRPYKGFFRITSFMASYSINIEEVIVLYI
jgi:hypothetical protein